MRTKQILAGVLTSVSLAATGLGMAAGTAVALPAEPHVWCPGQPMDRPTGPGANYVWDMSVCHTWRYIRGDAGNVGVRVPATFDPVTFQPTSWEIDPHSNVWEGPNPPPPGTELDCGHDLFGFPIRC